jgi:RNA polymerase sigma factor (sigma-70 family)
MSHGAATTLVTATEQVGETDESLMERYASGDAAAFDVLYARHRSRLFRYLLHQTRSRASAEELYQDVWMKLIAARERYTPSARFTTFLLTLAHNRLIDHYRERPRASSEFDEEQGSILSIDAHQVTPIDPAYQAELNQQIRRIDDALATLSIEQREIFLLRQESDLNLEELAAITGVSRETAKSRLRYAIGHLKRLMAESA